MSNILSQDEVDALLKGVQSGEITTGTAKEKIISSIRPYDLASQERLLRGRLPGLEIANERFARFFRNSIANLIMHFVDVKVQNVEIIKFSDFMKTIPSPSSINIFKMEPLKGYSLLVLEAPLVFAFVEFFFGGKGAPYIRSEGRAFTVIEQRIIKKVVTMALTDMANAWAGLAPINPEQAGSEMNPQFVTIVTPSESVIKIEIHIEIEDFTGTMLFCVPYSLIEPVKEKLYSGIQSERSEADQRWVERMKEILLDSSVEVVAELGRVELVCEELMNLDTGSVITLGKSVTDDLAVKVANIQKFSGQPGYSRGNQALRITKIH
ncbi:MAG TPA: flagellar motor switch protein FliM [Nitrospiraceae bacterium]|jgi:flagellar motor switch protein FliM|nr:flagellar motor switch protein FliM [Nitrospiraceae bacterium]